MVKPFTDCAIGAEWGTYLKVLFDDKGTLYVAFAANDPAALASSARDPSRKVIPRHIFLARSDDGGRSFETTRVYDAPDGDPARGYSYAVTAAIDPENSKRLFVTWAQGDFLSLEAKTHAAVATSTDGGKTFSEPVDITDKRGSEGAWLAVGRDGTVHAAYFSLGWDGERTLFQLEPEDPPLALIHARSTDGGRTWTQTEIDPGYQQYERPPQIVADPNSDSLYVVWFGSPEPDNLTGHMDESDRSDIWVLASPDGGETWAERVQVNDDDGPATNQIHPGADVAADGRLDVAWYDFRDSPTPGSNPLDDEGFTHIYLSSSTDGGRTFTPNIRVSDRAADRSLGVLSNNVNSAGPVGIVSSDDSTISVAWQDTRAGSEPGQAEDIYAASVLLEAGDDADAGIDPLQAALLGAGGALTLGGLLLIGAVALTRRT
jgi:hypothetical protein